MDQKKPNLAVVIGNLPTTQEIDQLQLLEDQFAIQVVSSQSICGFLAQNCYFNNLNCIALPDHDDNPTFMPGLEKVLAGFDYVVVKERLGLYAYQAVRAKWQSRFKLISWVDNLTAFPADDISQMRTVREEITKAADAFIVQTEAAKNTLLAEGVEESRILRMLPWVNKTVNRDKKSRAQALADLGLSEGNFVIGFFGQIEWEEGLVDLVGAIKTLALENPKMKEKIKIVFSGIGSYSSELRQCFIKMGVDETSLYVVPNRRSNEAILTGADAVYISSVPARDRVDGDPYRVLTAMVNGVPVLASRTSVIEEYCGKHRMDFCLGSPSSLASAIVKLAKAAALKNDIVNKNLATVESLYSKERVQANMISVFEAVTKTARVSDKAGIDQAIQDIEARIKAKQYVAAVDAIESVFKRADVPVHHQATLYRLIGDCFAKLGDLDGAKDAYIKSIDLDQYSARVYIGLGTISLLKQSYDVAVLHFQKAVSLAPEDELANLGLGLGFQGMNEFKESTSWVNKALEINPENTAAIFTLVKNSHEQGEYVSVEQALARYLDIHPLDHNMLYTLGGVKFKAGKYSDVVALMNRIVQVDPLDNRAGELLKEAKARLDHAMVSSSKS
jgi:glycosyltransferase involved in cell wall biosynthesis/Tfp pilus assembly protein PilF